MCKHGELCWHRNPQGFFKSFVCWSLLLDLADRCAEPNTAKHVPEEGRAGKFLFFPIKDTLYRCANKWSIGLTAHIFRQTEIQFEEMNSFWSISVHYELCQILEETFIPMYYSLFKLYYCQSQSNWRLLFRALQTPNQNTMPAPEGLPAKTRKRCSQCWWKWS